MAVTIETWLRAVGGIVLLLGNGFFVTTEFALTRVRQFDQSEFTGSRGLERAWNMTERLEIFLSGCQVGITVCSIGLGIVAEPAVTALFGELLHAVGFTSTAGHTTASVVVAFALINMLHVIIGEQAPTYLGIERAKVVAKYGSGPLYWWAKLMSPIILVADRIAKGLLRLFGVDISRSWAEEELEEGEAVTSRAELRSQMGERMSQIGMTNERVDEVINALEIGQITVREIMVESGDIVALSTKASLDENLDRMEGTPHVRFPLVDGDLENFVGIVYAPTVLHNLDGLESGETTFEELATPPLTVAADTTVSDFIDQCQAENQELALVLEGGEVVGLITATDAFEEVLGELEDPMDREAA